MITNIVQMYINTYTYIHCISLTRHSTLYNTQITVTGCPGEGWVSKFLLSCHCGGVGGNRNEQSPQTELRYQARAPYVLLNQVLLLVLPDSLSFQHYYKGWKGHVATSLAIGSCRVVKSPRHFACRQARVWSLFLTIIPLH